MKKEVELDVIDNFFKNIISDIEKLDAMCLDFALRHAKFKVGDKVKFSQKRTIYTVEKVFHARTKFGWSKDISVHPRYQLRAEKNKMDFIPGADEIYLELRK